MDQNIDIKDYLKDIMRFLLLEYQPKLVECLIDLVRKCKLPDFEQQEYFFETFKTEIFQCLMKNPEETLDIIERTLQSSPELLFFFVEELVFYAQRNKHANIKILAEKIIKKRETYYNIADKSESLKHRLFEICCSAALMNEKFLVTSSSRELPLPTDLNSWILEIEDPNLPMLLKKLRPEDSNAWLRELESNNIKRLDSVYCLQILLKQLVETRSSSVFEGIIGFSKGSCKLLFKGIDTNKYLKDYFATISNEIKSIAIELIYWSFKDMTSSPEERLDILDYFLLPSLDNHQEISVFYDHNYKKLASLFDEDFSDSDVLKRKHALISRLGSYKLFELMYGKLPKAKIDSYNLDTKESLNIYLFRQAFASRSFCSLNAEEHEIARIFHCSALNCYIAAASLNKKDNFLNVIFKELPTKNQLIWEKIVDLKRDYNFDDGPKKLITKTINIQTLNTKKSVTLEDDEMNDHECMPMIVGVLIHAFNSKTRQEKSDVLPTFLDFFHEAFRTKKKNVKLFLLKIILNASHVFLPYLDLFFESIVKTMNSYLAGNPLNYIIEDVIWFLLHHDCEIDENMDKINALQEFLDILIERASNKNFALYRYNFHIIENIMKKWNVLKIPKYFDSYLEEDPDRAIRIAVILFRQNIEKEKLIKKRNLHKIIRKAMFSWKETLISREVFETLGLILYNINQEDRDNIVETDLIDLFIDMQNLADGTNDFCARIVYFIFLGCPTITEYENLDQFINPKILKNDECKAQCFEMFVSKMDRLEPEIISDRLKQMDLQEIFRDKVFPCLDVGFRIIKKLVTIFDAEMLLPYCRLMKLYTKKDELVAYKKIAYDFLMSVYNKCLGDITESNKHSQSVIKLCQSLFINGITDPSDEVQEKVMNFWKIKAKLPDSLLSRIEFLLQMYDSEVHSNFAQFICLLILDLANKSPGKEKILYAPIVPCDQENNGAETPPKKPRINGQQCAISLTNVLTRSVILQNGQMNGLQGSPVEENGNSTESEEHERVHEKPFQRTLSKRSVLQEEDNSLNLKITRNYADEYHQQLESEMSERKTIHQKNKFKIRSDTEIKQSDLVVALENVLLKDKKYASDLLIPLICSIMNVFKTKQIRDKFVDALTKMCTEALKQPNDFAEMALKILYECNCGFNADDVANISESMGLESLGILILEKSSINFNGTICTQSKKISMSLQYNLQLAKLYRSIGERDVVTGIFKNWKSSSDSKDLRKASRAEAVCDWISAKTFYEQAYGKEVGFAKDYCLEGMFQCLCELLSWSDINKKIKCIMRNDDYDTIWKNPKHRKLIPWIFKAQLHKMIEDMISEKVTDATFTRHFENWININGESIMKIYGEELTIFYLFCDNISSKSMARKCFEKCLVGVTECWTNDSEPKDRLLVKLQRLHEIDAYMKALELNDSKAARELLNYWDKNLPEKGDSLSDWIVLVNYRLAFAHNLKKLENVAVEDSILTQIDVAAIKQRLQLHIMAIENRNKTVARKQGKQIDQIFQLFNHNDDRFITLRHEFELASSRYKFLCGDLEDKFEEKFDYYSDAWEIADKLTKNNQVNSSIIIQAKHLIFKVNMTLYNLMVAKAEFSQQVIDNEFVTETLHVSMPEQVQDSLFDYAFNIVKNVCAEGTEKEMAESFAIFADYCNMRIIEMWDLDLLLQEDFIFAVLNGMHLGSMKAARFFPCLLNQSFYKGNERNAKIFKTESEKIPSWMFLTWKNEIISHLATSLSPLVSPIALKLAVDFPTSLQWTFKNIYDTHPKLQNDQTANQIYAIIFADTETQEFFKAFEYLVQPEEYLRYKLFDIVELSHNLESFINFVDSLLDEVHNTSHLQGNTFKDLVLEHEMKISRVKTAIDFNEIKEDTERICTGLKVLMKERLKSKNPELLLLKNYSTFLSQFNGENVDIEIPTNNANCPVKIVGFEQTVEIVSSKLKIGIIGSDGKTYKFLVKHGTDLRQEKQMQRIFEIANDCLEENIKVKTYDVIPLTKRFGLVEWIDNVKSLKEILDISADKTLIDNVVTEYNKWIEESGGHEIPLNTSFYKRAVINYNAKNVIKKMNEFIGSIDWSFMRKSFMKYCHGPDDFLKLRQNFIKNYASMCLVHWLTGVGDRRLENTLVNLQTGECYGINFKLTFGAGIEQPIPELVPFRLTSQILGLMKPFKEQDLFGATMTRALTSLRNKKSLFLGSLNAFLFDDLNNEGLKWLRKQKFLEMKLIGGHPSSITLDELSSLRDNKNRDDFEGIQCYQRYRCIVNGTELHHSTIRGVIQSNNLTPAEQVQCLLDQATDLNILGRMWVGWCPFV